MLGNNTLQMYVAGGNKDAYDTDRIWNLAKRNNKKPKQLHVRQVKKTKQLPLT